MSASVSVLSDCVNCRYAYMEYVSETDAAEAAKKYRDVELDGHKLYVIKSMTDRMMGFGNGNFIFAYTFLLTSCR